MFVLGHDHDLHLQTVLYLLLPLHGLLDALCTKTVSPSASVKVEEAAIICFLRGTRRNTGRLRHSLHLTEVYRPLAMEVLPGVVVPQLVFDGIQHKISLLPSFEQGSPLIQVSLHSDVGVLILLLVVELVSNTVLAYDLSATTLGVELVQVVRGGVPRHGLVLGAGLGHVLPTLFVAVQTTILEKEN